MPWAATLSCSIRDSEGLQDRDARVSTKASLGAWVPPCPPSVPDPGPGCHANSSLLGVPCTQDPWPPPGAHCVPTP